MSNIAFYPGSFDPPSLGHLEIIRRAAKICDKLYVGIAKNTAKRDALFSVDERKALLEMTVQSLPNVLVCIVEGLVVDFAKDHHVNFLVRGLRPFSNHDNEFQMAVANREMTGVDTVFLMADKGVSHISSTLIREVGVCGHRLHDFVPAEIEETVFQKITTCR